MDPLDPVNYSLYYKIYGGVSPYTINVYKTMLYTTVNEKDKYLTTLVASCKKESVKGKVEDKIIVNPIYTYILEVQGEVYEAKRYATFYLTVCDANGHQFTTDEFYYMDQFK